VLGPLQRNPLFLDPGDAFVRMVNSVKGFRVQFIPIYWAHESPNQSKTFSIKRNQGYFPMQ